MEEVDLIVIHTCASRAEADLAISALESAGIEAMIRADTAGGMRPHIAWAGAGFQLLVREDDSDAAREVLEPSVDKPA